MKLLAFSLIQKLKNTEYKARDKKAKSEYKNIKTAAYFYTAVEDLQFKKLFNNNRNSY